jgi:hypothetical protein
LNLLPNTSYTIKSTLKPNNNKPLQREKNKQNENIKNIFTFITPEKKYLGLRIKNPVSLYMDKLPPKFQVLDYDS